MQHYLQSLLLTICALITSAQVPGRDFLIFATTQAPPTMAPRPTPRATGDFVLVNNRPVVGTMAPFAVVPPTAPTPQFLDCFGRCQTTSEYNPICGSDRQLYNNEQKFNCARFCGADIQIVRRGSCQGLFPMQRG